MNTKLENARNSIAAMRREVAHSLKFNIECQDWPTAGKNSIRVDSYDAVLRVIDEQIVRRSRRKR